MPRRARCPSRALVLGGGGVTGIAWEVGVVAGLTAAGIDLASADVVIGTSAGAFVGVAVASGHDLSQLFETQLQPPDQEIQTSATGDLYAEWWRAYQTGGNDPRAVGAIFGEIALANPEPVPRAARRAAVRARLVTTEWPASLRVTAIAADDGELGVFDRDAGISLVDAVSASGAVPGVWPVEHINGRPWTDGGMVSATNAQLAAGYDRVLVLAPIPADLGAIPGAEKEVAALGAHADALLIAPDEQSVEAIGPNMYDPLRRASAANAGHVQGTALAGAVARIW